MSTPDYVRDGEIRDLAAIVAVLCQRAAAQNPQGRWDLRRTRALAIQESAQRRLMEGT